MNLQAALTSKVCIPTGSAHALKRALPWRSFVNILSQEGAFGAGRLRITALSCCVTPTYGASCSPSGYSYFNTTMQVSCHWSTI